MTTELTAHRAVDATATPLARPPAAAGAPARSMSPSEGANWFFLDAAERLASTRTCWSC